MTEKTASKIEPVGVEGREAALYALILAFSADPTVRWMFPEARQFLEHFPNFAAAFGGASFEAGEAYQIDGFAGVSLWNPPGVHGDDEMITAIVSDALPDARHAEVFPVFEELDAYHPKEDHWYLPMIGVDPARQGGGLGGQLLAHTLKKCDADKLPAYLESSNPANVSLYRRFGFEPMGTIMIGGEPLMTPMLRPAR